MLTPVNDNHDERISVTDRDSGILGKISECSYAGVAPSTFGLLVHMLYTTDSIESALDSCAGGSGFELRPDQH